MHEARRIEQDVDLADALGEGVDVGACLRTSSRAVSAMPSLARVAMPLSSMSVAITVAPSRANAMAQARPMPAAAAVTNGAFALQAV